MPAFGKKNQPATTSVTGPDLDPVSDYHDNPEPENMTTWPTTEEDAVTEAYRNIPDDGISGNDSAGALTHDDLAQIEQADTSEPATATTPKRGRPKLSDLTLPSMDDLGSAIDIPEEEWDSHPLDETKQAPPRDAVQVSIDEVVLKVHTAWKAAGEPPAKTSPRSRYEVKPEFATATRAMLNRAAALHKVKVVPKTTHMPNGMVAIVFTARDRDPAKPKTSKK